MSIKRGLKQGDSLAPSLFLILLIVTEGLSGLMHEAVTHHLFAGVTLRVDRVTISHLKYTDDVTFADHEGGK